MTTKAYFIDKLAEALGTSKQAARAVYTAVAETTFASIKENGGSIIPGIGRVKCKTRPARLGRNPRTGLQVEISERKVLKFSISKLAKIRVNI